MTDANDWDNADWELLEDTRQLYRELLADLAADRELTAKQQDLLERFSEALGREHAALAAWQAALDQWTDTWREVLAEHQPMEET